MVLELAQNRFVGNPVVEVEKLLTRIWKHPLLDPKTIAARQQALINGRKFMGRLGFGESEYVGIPVGSFRWIMDNESDSDFTVLTNVQSFGGSYKTAKLFVARYRKIKYSEGIEIVELADGREGDFDFADDIMPALMLTPDEFLIGNIPFAQDFRLRAIKKIAARMVSSPCGYNIPWRDINIQLENYIKGWPERTDGDVKVSGSGENRSRQIRYKRNLNLRARQQPACKRGDMITTVWTQAFERARTNLHLPDFPIYASALRVTNGALSLDARYASIGIT